MSQVDAASDSAWVSQAEGFEALADIGCATGCQVPGGGWDDSRAAGAWPEALAASSEGTWPAWPTQARAVQCHVGWIY